MIVTEMLAAKASTAEISTAEISATEKSATEKSAAEISPLKYPLLKSSTISSKFEKKFMIFSGEFLSFRKLNKQHIKLMPLGLSISFLTLSNSSKQIKHNPSVVNFLF